jgi:hypothetical protein
MPPSLAEPLGTIAGHPAFAAPGAAGLLARLGEAFATTRTEGQRYLLLLRYTLLNLVGMALLAAAWLQGWLHVVAVSDTTHLCALIAGVFIVGVVQCGGRIAQTSVELNEVKVGGRGHDSRTAALARELVTHDGQSRAALVSALKLRLGNRIAGIRHLANSLVLLGLIGTVIGFIIALSGVDAAAATDVQAIGPMVSTLVAGMSVALYTTLVGSVLNIWLMLNYRLLESGTVKLITAIVEHGERHGRA